MQNMVINDLMDLIKKLFNDNYENIFIVDSSDREEYETWCIGRTYYDDLEQCYKRSDFKISKELAEKFEKI